MPDPVRVSLEEFLRTGRFGPVHFAMTRQQVRDLLGEPVYALPERGGPTLFNYGIPELYFVSPTDDRLCTVDLHHFDVPHGTDHLLIDAGWIRGGLSRADVEARLKAADIDWVEVPVRGNPDMVGLSLESGVVLGLVTRPSEYDPFVGLYFVQHSILDRLAPKDEPAKQVSVSIPASAYEKLRQEAVRTRKSVSHICGDWIRDRASQLPGAD